MLDFGTYDVVVAGGGVSGVVAAVAAAREGAKTCLVEASGMLGGLITGGRLTKPSGVIQPGVYADLITLAAKYGGADPKIRYTKFGAYSGIFDAEVMQRCVIETIEQAGVQVLMYAPVTDVVLDGQILRGLILQTKMGRALISAKCIIDATGDGDVAALAGVPFLLGRKADGITQPMTAYIRVIGVNIPRLLEDCRTHKSDMLTLTIEDAAEDNAEPVFHCKGFAKRIRDAIVDGFDWIVPHNTVTMKSALLPGEVNVNACRVAGNALDPWVRSRAVLEVRKQAYCVIDFLKAHVGGFENAKLLEIAPVLGVRETRRIMGDYVITADDVHNETRFDDAIGLCTDPVDIHDGSGPAGHKEGVGEGFGVPWRALLAGGIEGLLTAGRCISADDLAYGATRNTPTCAMTAQAAGIGAALAAADATTPRRLGADRVQAKLRALGVVLGTDPAERMPYAVERMPNGRLPHLVRQEAD